MRHRLRLFPNGPRQKTPPLPERFRKLFERRPLPLPSFPEDEAPPIPRLWAFVARISKPNKKCRCSASSVTHSCDYSSRVGEEGESRAVLGRSPNTEGRKIVALASSEAVILVAWVYIDRNWNFWVWEIVKKKNLYCFSVSMTIILEHSWNSKGIYRNLDLRNWLKINPGQKHDDYEFWASLRYITRTNLKKAKNNNKDLKPSGQCWSMFLSPVPWSIKHQKISKKHEWIFLTLWPRLWALGSGHLRSQNWNNRYWLLLIFGYFCELICPAGSESANWKMW